MNDEELCKKLYKHIEQGYADDVPTEEIVSSVVQLIKQDRGATEEDMLHRFTDRLSWEVAHGHIEMTGINVEQLVSKLTHHGEQLTTNSETPKTRTITFTKVPPKPPKVNHEHFTVVDGRDSEVKQC